MPCNCNFTVNACVPAFAQLLITRCIKGNMSTTWHDQCQAMLADGGTDAAGWCGTLVGR